MTAYRDAELLRTIRRTAGRITVHGYRSREQRQLAATAADALRDLADALDADRQAEPVTLADLRTRLVERVT